MLDQLWDYWRYYQSGRWDEVQCYNAARYWLDQHCLDADDFAFGIALAMRNWMEGH